MEATADAVASSLNHIKHPINQSICHTGSDAVEDDRAGDCEYLRANSKNEALCVCQFGGPLGC